MKVADLTVGQVIEYPDWRGYRVTKIRPTGIPGYVTLYLTNQTDHHDCVTASLTANTEVKVVG